jgi:biotin-(acetyl-CoA carboxylase) ligase
LSITTSLHFSTKFFANKNKDEVVVNHNQNTGLSRGTRTWLNISGIGLTLSGFLKEEKVSNNPQTIAGLSIVVATFLLDLILKDF